MNINSSLQENMRFFNEQLATDKNFDVICKEIYSGSKKACIYFIDGFTKDEIMERIIAFLYQMPADSTPQNARDLAEKYIPYIEVDLLKEKEAITTAILSGATCLFVEGYAQCISIDCRTYPARGVQEPEKDKVLRGSRDGFVETLVFNTALIRRRIRDPELSMEMFSVGSSSKSDIVLCYMDGRVNAKCLEIVREKLANIRVDALTMNQESLAECLFKRKWLNPFPKFKFTERPDTTAACVLEGKIAVIIDNSAAAMILPTTFFDIMDQADDYYFPPVTGTYLRMTRFLITLLTVLITPIWLLLMNNPQWVPEAYAFIVIKEPLNIPVIFQLLILELAIDGMKLAAVNTPNMLTTPLSIVAGLAIGEYSVQSGWFNPETMLYMAFVVLANYTQANLEFGYALKFMRIFLLILTQLFHLPGFIIGNLCMVLLILMNKTIGGNGYLYPLIPFDGKELKKILFRKKIQTK
jgi:Bacillus/Clostridium GerA spore germination protein.